MSNEQEFVNAFEQNNQEQLLKYSDKIDWCNISEYQKLSEEFITAHNLKIEDSNWLYKDNQYKLNFLKNIGLYEIVDNKYIIAYKSCRSDGYSKYNFQYKYEMGNEYTSHCDCTGAENSFGLSAWTKEKAIEYCKQKLLKVKINIEDIGIVVHEGGKIRCRKLTVLSEE